MSALPWMWSIGTPRLRQRFEAIDWVVLRQLFFQFCRRQPVCAGRVSQPGIAAQVAHRIDAGDAADLVGILRGPVVQHQPAPALGQQPRLGFKFVFADDVLVKLREDLSPRRAAVRFTDVDAAHVETPVEQFPQDPFVALVGIAADGRRIPDPGPGALRRRFRRLKDECLVFADVEDRTLGAVLLVRCSRAAGKQDQRNGQYIR